MKMAKTWKEICKNGSIDFLWLQNQIWPNRYVDMFVLQMCCNFAANCGHYAVRFAEPL